MNKKIICLKNIKNIKYECTWEYQKKLFSKILNKKKLSKIQRSIEFVGYLLFVEYTEHIYTIGKNGKPKNHLLITSNFLKKKNAQFYKIDRGGDITYHGPGQLVIYPILDLQYFFMDIHKYIRFLEEVIIQSLWIYKISGIRYPGNTGVWIFNKGEMKKICSIGIRMSRWISMHGLAFNINTDLKYFNYITPCGIQNCKMTSLEKELKYKISFFDDVKNIVKKSFQNIFQVEIVN